VIYGNCTLPDAKMAETMEKYNDSLRQAGALLSVDSLQPPANGARIKFGNGKGTVTHGPFPCTNETLGGFWMFRAKSLGEAIEWASRAPMTDGDVIEVRQVQKTEDFPAEVQRVLAASGRRRPRPRPGPSVRGRNNRKELQWTK